MSYRIHITVYAGKPGKRAGTCVAMGRPSSLIPIVLKDFFSDQPGIQAVADGGGPQEVDFKKLRSRLARKGAAMAKSATDVSLASAIEELRALVKGAPDDAVAFAHVAY